MRRNIMLHLIARLCLASAGLVFLVLTANAQMPAPLGPNSVPSIATNLIPVTSNQTLYVAPAPTGNDSNPCTLAAKCATITHAMSVLKGYDFGYQYTATVNVADGTYTGTVTLPALHHYPQYPAITQWPALTGNISTPTNVVIQSASGDAVNTEMSALWDIQGFQLKSTSGSNSDLYVAYYSFAEIGSVDFAGNNILVNVQAYSFLGSIGNFTSSSSSFAIAINVFVTSWFINDASSWTINNSPTVSNVFASIGDGSVLGAGTYTNGGTVTGNRLALFNNSIVEFTGARSSFPGSGSVTITQPARYDGDTNSVLGAYTNSSATLAGTIALSDGAGNLQGDYNITVANAWTFQNGFKATSAALTSNGIELTNTSTGGHDAVWLAIGASGQFGRSAGQFMMLDITNGNVPFWWDTSANFTLSAMLGFSSQTAYTANAPDTGLSRVAANRLAAGNGTAGDASGGVEAATHIATGGSPTGTTGSCSASSFTGGKTAGKFTAPTCAAGTIILSALPTAPNGYTCDAQDQTTSTDTLKQTANTTTSVTFTATTANNDVVAFKCMGW